MSKRIIGIVGMPGSGKSVADKVAMELGFSIIIMGDIIREEVTKRGLLPTPENVGEIMVKIRREEGAGVVAKRCIPKIQWALNGRIIVEGLRSLAEVYELRRSFPNFKLIAIYTSPKVRFYRIFGRNRSDDSISWQTFVKRDHRELRVGIGSVIALADYMIINEGSIQCFQANFKKCLRAALVD